MKNYWNEKNLIEDYKSLETLYNNEKNPEIKKELSSYLKLLKEKIIEFSTSNMDYYEDLSQFSYLDILKKDITSYREYYPFIENLDQKIYLNTSSETLIDSNISLSIDDMMKLIKDFFNHTNKEFLSLFIKTSKKGHIRELTISGADALMFYIPVLDKIYISLKKNLKRNRKLLTLLHEEGHAVGALLNPDRYFWSSILIEVESLFFEMIGSDYFAKELNDPYFLQSQIINLEYYKMIALEISDEKILADLYEKNKNLNPKKMNRLIEDHNLSHLLLNDIPITTGNMKYLISYLVAVELYEVYQGDKDLALNMLKEIIMQEKGENNYGKITNVVTPTASLDSYQKRLLLKKASSNNQ